MVQHRKCVCGTKWWRRVRFALSRVILFGPVDILFGPVDLDVGQLLVRRHRDRNGVWVSVCPNPPNESPAAPSTGSTARPRSRCAVRVPAGEFVVDLQELGAGDAGGGGVTGEELLPRSSRQLLDLVEQFDVGERSQGHQVVRLSVVRVVSVESLRWPTMFPAAGHPVLVRRVSAAVARRGAGRGGVPAPRFGWRIVLRPRVIRGVGCRRGRVR